MGRSEPLTTRHSQLSPCADALAWWLPCWPLVLVRVQVRGTGLILPNGHNCFTAKEKPHVRLLPNSKESHGLVWYIRWLSKQTKNVQIDKINRWFWQDNCCLISHLIYATSYPMFYVLTHSLTATNTKYLIHNARAMLWGGKPDSHLGLQPISW